MSHLFETSFFRAFFEICSSLRGDESQSIANLAFPNTPDDNLKLRIALFETTDSNISIVVPYLAKIIFSKVVTSTYAHRELLRNVERMFDIFLRIRRVVNNAYATCRGKSELQRNIYGEIYNFLISYISHTVFFS